MTGITIALSICVICLSIWLCCDADEPWLKSLITVLIVASSITIGIKTTKAVTLKKGVETIEVIFYCPECHTVSSSKNKYCNKCGTKFDIWENYHDEK